jgi:hypothetical protein
VQALEDAAGGQADFFSSHMVLVTACTQALGASKCKDAAARSTGGYGFQLLIRLVNGGLHHR